MKFRPKHRAVYSAMVENRRSGNGPERMEFLYRALGASPLEVFHLDGTHVTCNVNGVHATFKQSDGTIHHDVTGTEDVTCPWCGAVQDYFGHEDDAGPHSCRKCDGGYDLAVEVTRIFHTDRGMRKSDLPKDQRPKRKTKGTTIDAATPS